ncbi:MAG TPA: DUF4337 domain-containing protein [Moraxellaceae bacterium]|nr:DUF4337 domain-containing protein [Moraxellaceae bacterium]
MSDEPKTNWVNFVALTTVIFAVGATLSTFKGGGFSTRSVISQAQASDQWAYYQAKSIRASMNELQKDNLSLQLAVLPHNAPREAKQHYEDALATTDRNIAKYKQQRQEIETRARALEAERDDAQRHGRPFGLAVIFFQIAIVLCSITALFKRKELWFVAMAVGAVGMVFFADGFWLFL